MDTTAVAGGPDNTAIAERLETLAALLDLAGASTYSVRAYRRAAELIRATPAPVAELVRQGRVRELRGVGPSIEARAVWMCCWRALKAEQAYHPSSTPRRPAAGG